jgi:hypothetical protein
MARLMGTRRRGQPLFAAATPPEWAEDTQGLTMTYFKRTFSHRAFAAVLATVAVLGVTTTQASTPYDGNWSVVIRANNGECKTSQIPLRIQNGSVAYNGYIPVSVSGSVGGSGSVTVSVSGGGRSANGSGVLSGNSGSGTWTGGSSANACSGTWSARKA